MINFMEIMIGCSDTLDLTPPTNATRRTLTSVQGTTDEVGWNIKIEWNRILMEIRSGYQY